MALTLYSAWRATSAYRVRIGLNLKQLAYDYVAVDLVGGEQHKAPYRAVNPQRFVPALDVDGRIITQSLPILEWLEETQPEPPLLPEGAWDRQTIRTMCAIIASDIHPLNNTRVGRALAAMKVSDTDQKIWIQRWINDGFQVLEPMIAEHGKRWAFGDEPTMADCCLIPQLYSAHRYSVDLTPFPAIRAVAETAAVHPAFVAAHPTQQPDAAKT